MPVRFFQEDTDFAPGQKNPLKKWISSVIRREGAATGEINYVFCSDNYLLDINKKYLDHDYYTDIITFDQSEDNLIAGDIYISVDRVRENAANSTIPFKEELKRVMIHGILHLLGYDDKSEEEKKQMRKKEEACLSLYVD